MPKNQTPIFATKNDLSALLREVCEVIPVELAVMGLFDEVEPEVLPDPLMIQPLTSYLAFKKGIRVVSRAVEQRGGRTRFVVDPMVNPRTVVIRCGGQVGERLTAGDISVATNHDEAGELFGRFSKVIRRRFLKIKSYYVGPEAVRQLDEGIRLTPTGRSPSEYDLVR